MLEAGERGLVVLDGDRTAGLDPGVGWSPTATAAAAGGSAPPVVATRRRRSPSRRRSARRTTGRGTDPALASHTRWEGVASVSASSSVATDLTLAGLRPAGRPAAALDGDPLTAWSTFGDPEPSLVVRLEEPASVPTVRVATLRREGPRAASVVGEVTRVRVSTDAGTVTADLDAAGTADVALPDGPTRTVEVEVLDTDAGPPSDVLTGLATVEPAGVQAREVVALPESSARYGPVDTVVLDAGLPGSAACVRPRSDVVCLGAAQLGPRRGRDARAPTAGCRRRLVRRLRDAGAAAGGPPGRARGRRAWRSRPRAHAAGRRPAGRRSCSTRTRRRPGARPSGTCRRRSPSGSPDRSTSGGSGSTTAGAGSSGTAPSSR